MTTGSTPNFPSDVAGRQLADASATSSNMELFGVFDAVDVPIVLIDKTCKVVHFNKAAAEALGVNAADIGLLPGGVTGLKEMSDIESLCEQVLADGAPCRLDMRRGDQWFLVRIATYTGREGQVCGAALTFTNVTGFRASIGQAIHEREYTKAIFNTLAEPIVILNNQLCVQTANRAFYDLFGMSRDQTQGTQFRDLGNEQWKKSVLWSSIDSTLAGNRNFQMLEIEREVPTLGMRTLLVDARRLSHEKNNSILLVFRDITERKLAEAARSKLAAIVESSDDGIVSKDLNGMITSWNRGAERLFGYTAKETIGQHISMLFPPDRLNEELNILKRIRNGETISHFETVRRRKDGSLFHVSLTVSPIVDSLGNIVGASKIARNITKRKSAEEALRQSESRLQAFLETAAICLHRVGPDGNILWANEAELTLLGYPAEEYIGRHIKEFHVDQEVISNILNRLHNGEVITNCKARMKCKNGSIRTVMIDSSVLWDHGRFIHTQCFTRDITENERLEQSLKEANRHKDEFLATLAHELRNPLAPVRNALMILNTFGPPEPVLKRAREIIDRQVLQMVRLIDDLLDVSRITRGILELRRESVPLSKVIDQAIETSRPHIEQGRHQFSFLLPPEPIHVDCDPVRLAQIFSNLLINACKYTDNGGCISLVAARDDREVVVRVKDNGVGIPVENLPKMFEMFAQVSPNSNKSKSGLGIGLSLARRLVEMHGGRIEALSEGSGKGSEFVVRLPVIDHDEAPQTVSQDSSRVLKASVRQRILIVDDSYDIADSLSTLLKHAGHEVQIAHDGFHAIEAAQGFRPNVVLLDIGMPKMDGIEACERIRREPWGAEIYIVALTGWGAPLDQERTAKVGFNAHLVKPVDPESLMHMIAGDARTRLNSN